MTLTEKRINQTLNILQLIHEENLVILGLIKNITTSNEEQKNLESYIEQCRSYKQQILSGIYEDDVTITN